MPSPHVIDHPAPQVARLRPLPGHLLYAGVLTGSLLGLATPVWAQAGDVAAAPAEVAASAPSAELPAARRPAELSQVVVTAQKRSQRLKDVPLAVSVVQAEVLEKQGLRDITDLAKSAASLEFGDTKSGGAGGSASIRGIGTAVFTTSAESSVGVVVDGVPLGNIASGALFDMERVEVLRGPQGTLFGKNASAGVLNMVTKAPKLNRFEGFASTELAATALGSDLGNTVLRAGVNVPLGETTALRATAHVDRLTGVYHNVFNGQDSATTGAGARIRFLWRPDADTSLNLIAEHDRWRESGAVFFAPTSAAASNTAGNHAPAAEFAACGVTVSHRNNEVCSDGPEQRRQQIDGLSAQFDRTLADGLALTSITAWRQRRTGPDFSSIDMGSGWDKVRSSDGRIEARQITQELRLASPTGQTMDWVAGLFLSDYRSDKTNTTTILPNPVLAAFGVPTTISTLAETATRTNSAALFGQSTWKLSPATSVLAGLRLTHDRVRDEQTQTGDVVFSSFALPTTVKTAGATLTSRNVSGKIGLQHRLSPQSNVYATLGRGYKGPQIDNDTALSNGQTAGLEVRPELSTSLEAGLKTSLLARRVDLDVAVFHNRIRDFQEQSCLLSAVGALTCTPLNVPHVTSQGVEADVRARVTPQLTLSASGALVLGTRYPGGFQFDGQDVGGQRLLYSPKAKVTLGAEYGGEVGEGWAWSVGGDMTYKSRVRYCNTLDAECSYGEHVIVGLRGGLRSPDDRWGVALFVRNLTDERVPGAVLYPLPGKGGGSGHAWSLGANSFRTVGLQADVKF
ncbi:TonB-dependent receptor [Pseudaquabacterium rugosum]|uniref:TonB-dependent receptor n=1 Tax=Pseudaquabacterium rugosum TaxID=2984194 RepID=A0ABU9BJQ5_9BURK